MSASYPVPTEDLLAEWEAEVAHATIDEIGHVAKRAAEWGWRQCAMEGLREASAALAQAEPEVVGPSDGPAVPEGREPASVVGEPSDEELLEINDGAYCPGTDEVDDEDDPYWQYTSDYIRWLDENGTPQEQGAYAAKGLRAVFEAGRRWGRPAPALVGERQAAPVPVASDVYFEFVVSDADYCTQAGGIAPSYAQAVSEGQHYLAQYQQDGPHTLELRRVEVLPLPSGEAKA